VSGVGRRMGVLDGDNDRRREGAVLRVNLGRPIVTNGDFVAQLCDSDALFPNYSPVFGRVHQNAALETMSAIYCSKYRSTQLDCCRSAVSRRHITVDTFGTIHLSHTDSML